MLVAASGDNLTEDPEAFGILTDMVEATLPGNPTLAENPSEINGTGIAVGQAAFTYSRLVYGEKLAVGANAKLMSGRTYYNGTRVADIDGDDDIDDYIDQENTASETQLGIDLGVMYRPSERWSIGIAANNVNAPEFKLSGGGQSIVLEPLVRAGAAYRPLRWFNLALDVDLTQVDSGVVRDLSYRYANFGAEFLIGQWFAGRIGAYRNFGVENSNTIYTGGLGFGFRRFSIDLAVGAAAEQTRLETVGADGSIPRGFAASLQFNWRPKREHRQI